MTLWAVFHKSQENINDNPILSPPLVREQTFPYLGAGFHGSTSMASSCSNMDPSCRIWFGEDPPHLWCHPNIPTPAPNSALLLTSPTFPTILPGWVDLSQSNMQDSTQVFHQHSSPCNSTFCWKWFYDCHKAINTLFCQLYSQIELGSETILFNKKSVQRHIDEMPENVEDKLCNILKQQN